MPAVETPSASLPVPTTVAQSVSPNDPNDLPNAIVDYVPITFEQVVRDSRVVMIVDVVAVDPDVTWNTETGEIGPRELWSFREGWQSINVEIVEVMKGDPGGADGEVIELAYDYFLSDNGEHFLDETFVGTRGVVSAWWRKIGFADGTVREMLNLASQGTYFARSDGPALRVFSFGYTCPTDWRRSGGLDQPVPETTTAAVARSLDEIVDRARHPDVPLENQLGFESLDPDTPTVCPESG